MVAEKIKEVKKETEEEELSPEELVTRLQEFLNKQGIGRIAEYRGTGLGLYFFNLKDSNKEYSDASFGSKSLKWSDVFKEAKNALKGWI